MMSGMSPESSPDPRAAQLRGLPSVDALIKQPAVSSLLDEYPRGELVQAIRTVLEERRAALRAGAGGSVDVPSLALEVRQKLRQRAAPHLRRVINATGIVLHTNLGRAPLAEEAVTAITEIASGYCNLELELQTGRRGDRHEHVRELLRELTGAEDGFVVNNNAAGTYLTLAALAADREVIVSRGQLVEIGGSYRMPEIMRAARCRLVEVGTTNRTRLSDYERAVTDQTAVLLHVHTSNYRIQGFVESTPVRELVELARRYRLWVVDDLGSGLLDRSWPWPRADEGTGPAWPPADEEEAEPSSVGAGRSEGADFPPPLAQWDEPSVRESVSAGADLTLFSADKLLGGPQAGIIVGRAELIERLRRSPIARAVRPDKLTLAGLEATLRLFRDPEALCRRHPVLRMLSASRPVLEKVAVQLEHAVSQALPGAEVLSVPDYSEAGGGSLPTVQFPTWTVRVRHPQVESVRLAAALRQLDVPIICRVQDEALVLDCRTLLADDVEQIAAGLAEASRELLSA